MTPLPIDGESERKEEREAIQGEAADTASAPTSFASFASSAGAQWPLPMGPAVRIGIFDKFLDLVEQQSEADPAAILATLLVFIGSAVHRGPHFVVDGVRHGCNLFVLVIGTTSQGRKGTSVAYPRRLMQLADPEWCERILGGLSSGEGLIEAVRDTRLTVTDDDEPIGDEGVIDKRCLAYESEFGRTLRAMARQGSTLAQVLRQAWDGDDLRTMTKTGVSATGAHVSVLGHGTQRELLAEIGDAAIHGGTMNRFLFVGARRQRQLPFGGHVADPDLETLAADLRRCIDGARLHAGEMLFTDAARAVWPATYNQLTKTEQRPGLAGAVLARAIPQVRRLAMVFAIGCGSRAVDVPHVEAAVEFWRYCEDSARFAFGERTGDRNADKILDELVDRAGRGQPGLSRRDMTRQMFSGHVSGPELTRALDLLLKLGLAHPTRTPTGGRDAEVWTAGQEVSG